tara:strand:+ start:625 stop:1077 length:453 start_codon:yes stop_codon:yes gene_type:complete
MRKLLSKNKKPRAKDYEKIITIQEKIIKANNERIAAQEQMYMELWCDGMDLKDAYVKQSKELEQVYRDRNEAIRRYNALHQLGEMAQGAGVDLTEKLPENEKVKWKDHKFDIKARVLESGKTTFTATLKKNLSQEDEEFSKLHNKGKKKK